jgi:hypothetical protein
MSLEADVLGYGRLVASDSQSRQLVQRLQREFKETLGIDLHVGRFSTPESIFLEPSAEAEDRFGEFRVLVLGSSHDAELLLQAKRPNAHGVYWTESENELSRDPTPSWSAAKRYGRVLLRWWNVAPDETRNWRRLDAAVGNAVGEEA